MMHNIKLILEYDGTHYHGWQRQANLPTIQQTLEDVLAQITKGLMKVTGASRTDAGVHAVGQVAHFKSSLKIGEPSWVAAVNSLLPSDVVVKRAEYAAMEFHARYSAKGKVYRYVILNSGQMSPFLRNYAWHIKHPLDISSMKDAANCLIGTHDFSSFRASECGAKSPLRTLDRLEITTGDTSHIFPLLKDGGNMGSVPPFILLTFEARSYLQHMVRNIVGTLVDVGRGRLKPSDVRDILKKKDRRYAGPIAPPQGLFLVEIKYD